jgi:hypothetical protein
VTGEPASTVLKFLSQGVVPDGERTVRETEARELQTYDRWLLQHETDKSYDIAKAWFVARYGRWVDLDFLLKQRIVRLGRDHVYIPHWADTDIVGVKTRAVGTGDAGKKGAITGSTFTHRLYRSYPGDLDDVTVPAVLVEGESDYWAAYQWFGRSRNCAQVYGLPAGAGVIRQKFVDELLRHPVVFLATDADKAGQAAALKVSDMLLSTRGGVVPPVRRMSPPDGCDLIEGLEEGWQPRV